MKSEKIQMPLLNELRGPVWAIAESRWNEFKRAAAEVKFECDPTLRQESATVFAFSDFVYKTALSHPLLVSDLTTSGDLFKTYESGEYIDRIAKIDASSISDMQTALRRIRQREMLRIAWRDLSRRADLFEVLADLSAFAEACIRGALDFLYDRLCVEFGTPFSEDEEQQRLVVIAMGKLGAFELNFSSDIDLIFAYPKEGNTKGGRRSIGNEVFFSKLCRQLIQMLGAITPHGAVFRVDMRLRPYGESGPIAMSFDRMESYYQNQGREWERYAWIKARVVAGDGSAGRSLMNSLSPFVYRRYLDFGAFESLREMKQRIFMEVKRKGHLGNIKLGPGGIREIEFFGQMFQLIRGGVQPELRVPGILQVIEILYKKEYISKTVRDELKSAYIFHRKVENRLQENSDRQMHMLPTGDLDRLRLAAAMGFSDWESFCRVLDRHRNGVHGHFSALLAAEDSKEEKRKAEEGLSAVWIGCKSEVQCEKLLSDAGFAPASEALQLIEHLRSETSARSQSKEGRERLDRLMPVLLETVGRSDESVTVLNRIVDLIKAIQKRTSYLSLLLEHPGARIHLVRLAAASPWIVSYLSRHPVLLDELLDPRHLYMPITRSELDKSLKQRLAMLDPDDLEVQMEDLCVFRHSHVLRVAAADITGVLPLMKVSDHLTYIAESILEAVSAISWRYLSSRHGVPVDSLGGGSNDKGFAVVAYGKMGGLELGYDSDLDLVFLHTGGGEQTTGGPRPLDSPQFFARLGQRIVHILTAHTPAGRLYDIDMRLRPSGSSGVLVVHIDAFKDYQDNDAWTWEHQALIKARPVVGDSRLIERFQRIRRAVLSKKRKRDMLKREVSEMRSKIRRTRLKEKPGLFDLKQDVGGMVDIEFLVQYLVLANAHRYPELTVWTDNVRLIQTLSEVGIIHGDTAHLLREAYLIYRAAGHRLSLKNAPLRISADRFRPLRNHVIKTWENHLGKMHE